MKKYIQPAIKVQKMDTEALMAASLGINNEYSGSDQLAKPSFEEENDDQQPTTFHSVWADDDQD